MRYKNIFILGKYVLLSLTLVFLFPSPRVLSADSLSSMIKDDDMLITWIPKQQSGGRINFEVEFHDQTSNGYSVNKVIVSKNGVFVYIDAQEQWYLWSQIDFIRLVGYSGGVSSLRKKASIDKKWDKPRGITVIIEAASFEYECVADEFLLIPNKMVILYQDDGLYFYPINSIRKVVFNNATY